MKKFRFKYSTSVWLLLALVVVLSVAGMVWNIFNIKEYMWAGAFKVSIYAIIVAITACLAIFSISVMACGFYVIKGEYLYTRFGIVASKIKINDVTQIVHFKKSDKLVVYYGEDKYTVIVISPLEYDEFIKAMRGVNTKIAYGTKIDGEDTPD